MSDAISKQLDALFGHFITIKCCGQRVCDVNPRPYTRAGETRLETIRQRHVTVADPAGNNYLTDPETRAIRMDPNSFAAPDDGTRCHFTCPRCGAGFMWVGGTPQRAPKKTTWPALLPTPRNKEKGKAFAPAT
jgi:hypothetical protein